jgi:hypothetical protein
MRVFANWDSRHTTRQWQSINTFGRIVPMKLSCIVSVKKDSLVLDAKLPVRHVMENTVSTMEHARL